jgi:hypothetical protein
LIAHDSDCHLLVLFSVCTAAPIYSLLRKISRIALEELDATVSETQV